MEPTELRTKRLLLRPWRLSDVDDVFAYASDVDWGRYLPAPQPYLRRDAVEFVARAVLTSWDQEPTLAMVFEDRAAGGVNLDLDLRHRTAELGYSVAKDLWGLGLVPEAAKALLDWGFQSFPIEKVFARADARNRQSVRVMEKCGMKQEAFLRKHHHFRGERIDEIWAACFVRSGSRGDSERRGQRLLTLRPQSERPFGWKVKRKRSPRATLSQID